jgi:hypothetical protein
MGFHELAHYYQGEDIDELRRILKPGQYHAVVANPPYITVKDKALNQAYRDRYPEVCHMKYSLCVPFMKRIFDLAHENGFAGQITANSFMKREFGKKLVESYLPKIDLTHVIDTSGAYIPGHGTPTVILFGRQRQAVMQTIRAVMGIKGEPSTPEDPARGLVWSAILDQIDRVGSQSTLVSVSDTPREQFAKHPWSIGGGGAAELKEQLDESSSQNVGDLTTSIGFASFTGLDEVFVATCDELRRDQIPQDCIRRIVYGELVRDWGADHHESAFAPYDQQTNSIAYECDAPWGRRMWHYRTSLGGVLSFGGRTRLECGDAWWTWYRWIPEKYRTPLSIVFAFVTTHNHFVLDRGGKVFNRTAPVIKLPATANEDDHLSLLGLLNSSTACFWGRQVLFSKRGEDVGRWGEFLEWDGTKLQAFPLPPKRPLGTAKRVDAMAREFSAALPSALIAKSVPDATMLTEAHREAELKLGQMIALQEELDWQTYDLYGLLPPDQAETLRCDTPPALALGQRAFEIVLSRRIAAGEEESSWFTRHSSTPREEIPTEWPEEYKQVVQRRIEIIESDRNLGLIERPEYKRRWNTEPWEEQQERALRNWLLDRMESHLDLDGRMNDQKTVTARGNLLEPRLTSVAKVADLAKQDKDFMQVAELNAGRMDFDVANLVGDLVAAESVPCLPVLRYKPTGLDKRAAWERTWELQRLEDAVDALFDIERLNRLEPGKVEETLRPLVAALRIDEQVKPLVLREAVSAADYVAEAGKQKLDPRSLLTDAAKRARQCAVGDIPVPPKYTSADFLSSGFWRLRGKLDVPKERWVSFPHCEGEDGTLVIAWAGYDHLQLARAIAEYYEQAREHEGRKLVPLLACIGQLIPWLKQWHNELDPAFGTRMGDYFEGYLAEEAKALGMDVAQVMAWAPEKRLTTKTRRSRRKI